MNDLTRRSFFGAALGGFAAALGIARPGERLFAAWYPPVTLATPSWVTREVAAGYVKSLKFASDITRDYDAAYSGSVGDTVRVRLPIRYGASA